MSQAVLTLTPGGAPEVQSLGFPARSVIVDNYTSSYVQLPDVGKTIPPWVYGAVVPVQTNIARASLIPTVPAIPGPPVPISQCTLTWTAAVLPASAGHLLQQSQYSPISTIGTITTVGNGDTVTKTFPVPAGSLGIGFIVSSASGFFVPASVTTKGDVSNDGYVSETPVTVLAATGRFFPLDQNLVCGVTSATGPGQPAQVTFFALSYNPTINVTDVVALQVSGPVRTQTYDWNAALQFNNTTATLTGATPPAGKTAVLAAYSAHVATNAAATLIAQVSIKDGTGALVWGDIISIENVAFASDRAQLSGLAVPATTSVSPLTISIGAIGAAHFADLSIGGYFL